MPHTLKIILKVIAGIVLTIVLLFFGTLWYVNSHKNSVLKMVNTELDAKLNGTVAIGDMKPNFFQRFPNISLNLKNVLIRDKQYAVHHHTLLDAKDFTISVNAWSLLTGKLYINTIDIDNASVDLFTDSIGYSNLSVFSKTKKKRPVGSRNNYDSQLGKFSLTNVNFKVEDQQKKKQFDFIANRISGSMANPDTGWNAAFSMDVTVKSMAFNTRNGSFIRNKPVEGNLNAGYNENTGRLWVQSPSLDIANEPFDVNAVFETITKPSSFIIKLDAKEILWRRVSALLSPNIQLKLDQFNITQPIAVKGIISGSFAGGGDPLLKVTAMVKDNTVITPGGTIDNCSFEGRFTNEYQKGKTLNDDNSIIRLIGMKGTYRNLPFVIDTGSIINLTTPIATGNFQADFPLKNINELLGSRIASFSAGTASMRLQYKADIVNYRLNKPFVSGSIILKRAAFTYQPENIHLQNSSIAIYLKGNDLLLKNIRLQSGQSILNMEGQVKNFLNFYYDAPEKILLNWQINSPGLYLGEFLGFIGGSGGGQKKETAPRANSGNIINQLGNVLEKSRTNMHIKVEKMHYFKFLATDVTADLQTSENKVIIKNVGLKHAGGFLKMAGVISRGEKVNQLALETIVSHVDIHEFFDAFDNFGLKDFTAANLQGYLSAKTEITAGMTDKAALLPHSINGTIDLNLQNANLINFSPIGGVAKLAFPFRNFKNIKLGEFNAHFDVHGEQITIYPLKFSSSVINMDVAGVYGLNKGTDIIIDVPLRNPKKDTIIEDKEKLAQKRYKGIVLHLRAKADSTGKIKVGLNKDRK